MGSIEGRLRRLEQRHGGESIAAGTSGNARLWERYFYAHENARRELHGLEPLPDLPYTEEDREDDRRTLQETIPAYRERLRQGYQTGEGKAFLDAWQQRIEERLQEGNS